MLYTTLRMLHIIFGIFIGGTYLFLVPILEPRLRRLGSAIQGPVIKALMPVLTPVMMVSFIIVFGTGVTMTLMQKQGSLGSLLTTAWGLDILVGFIATITAMVIGFGIIAPTGIRLNRLGSSIEGRAPSPEEGQKLQQLSGKIEKLSRINFIVIMIALATMVISRYL